MTPREAHHYTHMQPRPAVVVDCDHAATAGKVRQLKSSDRHHHNVAVFHCGTHARRFSVSLRVRQSVAFAFGGFVSCVHHQGRRTRAPRKTTDRTVRRPTNWSKTFSQTSLSHCGERTQRRRSQPSSVAACAPSSATWKARANGPARPSQQSSKKFSCVIECATSA